MLARASGIGILGISGSGRKRSYNSALLRAAQELLPVDSALEIFDVSGLPLFNEDVELNPPTLVKEFKAKIAGAEAALIATPEFNYSVSAVLKNALEWGNRPGDDNSWDGKPAAIISASTGPSGGRRAQLHLRQIMVDLNMHPLNSPQLLVSRAEEKFDGNLALTDSGTREQLQKVLVALHEWTHRLGAVIVAPGAR